MPLKVEWKNALTPYPMELCLCPVNLLLYTYKLNTTLPRLFLVFFNSFNLPSVFKLPAFIKLKYYFTITSASFSLMYILNMKLLYNNLLLAVQTVIDKWNCILLLYCKQGFKNFVYCVLQCFEINNSCMYFVYQRVVRVCFLYQL